MGMTVNDLISHLEKLIAQEESSESIASSTLSYLK